MDREELRALKRSRGVKPGTEEEKAELRRRRGAGVASPPEPRRARGRKVSLCVHFVDGAPAQGYRDGKAWKKCAVMKKDVCACVDCTTLPGGEPCPGYEIALA